MRCAVTPSEREDMIFALGNSQHLVVVPHHATHVLKRFHAWRVRTLR